MRLSDALLRMIPRLWAEDAKLVKQAARVLEGHPAPALGDIDSVAQHLAVYAVDLDGMEAVSDDLQAILRDCAAWHLRQVEATAVPERLVAFLYALMRDHLPIGTIQSLVRNVEPSATNDGERLLGQDPLLMRFARDLGARLAERIR